MDELEKIRNAQRDVERRTFQPRELRVSEFNGKPVIEGYAAVFNEYSQDLGGFVEIIDPGFFDDVLNGDTRSLYNHNAEKVLGRTVAKTLEIWQDEKGLYQRTYPPVVPPDAASWAQDVLVTIKRGDVTEQSFAFRVKHTYSGDAMEGDEWYILGDLVVRRLKKGGCKELLDVSPATYAAYLQTDVSASTRSRFEKFKESIPLQAQADGQQAEWQEPLDSLQRRLELKSND